jgi:D-beta-D-heptose 7-phosphate kinase/D-beta-D-heptose 1-phosphate adenosyltransferase
MRSGPDTKDRRSGRTLEREELAGLRAERERERIVFTNGCFDILHRGHVALLAQARELGDCLVVGINSDESVRRLKGFPRPLVAARDRAFILLHLRSVDFVTVFDEDTPLETIAALRPDILVKGAEYGTGEIVGEELVSGSGGRVVRIPMVEGYSSSALIDRIGRSPED